MTDQTPPVPTASPRNRNDDLLKARAKALARPAEKPQSGMEHLHVVEFRLAQERYAIEQQYVQEIYPLETFTPLPCTPPHIMGIINLRGQILPVINIKKFFDLPESGITDLHVVVVVRVDDVELGVLADLVTGVREFPLDSLQASLPTLTGIRTQYLQGITREQVVILDITKILRDTQLMVNQEVDT